MGKRLPPGEAERRAAERKKRFWAGETHKRFDPKEGLGSREQYEQMAHAFVNGHTTQITPLSDDMVMLGFDKAPETAREIDTALRSKRFSLFRQYGSDVAPGYAEAFKALSEAAERLRVSMSPPITTKAKRK